MNLSRLLLLAGCLAACAGCGSEGALTIQLVNADLEDPFAGVATFEVRRLDESHQQVERFEVDAGSGADVDVGLLAAGRGRLDIRGLALSGARVSRGRSRLIDLSSATSGAELVPFSTPRVAVALPVDRVGAGSHAPGPDGFLDDWRASPALVLDKGNRVRGPAPLDASDLTAEVLLACDSQQLLLALRVHDSCPGLRVGVPAGRCDPAGAVERVFIGLDGRAEGGGAYDSNDLWLELAPQGLWVRRGQVDPARLAVTFAPLPDLSGWSMELRIALSVLQRSGLAPRQRIGLDVVVVDHDPGQAAATVLRWSKGGASTATPTPPASMGHIGVGRPAGS